MVTKCSVERSFSLLKYIQNRNRTIMRQEKLDSLSPLTIEADLLRKINFDDIIKDYTGNKSRKKNLKM